VEQASSLLTGKMPVPLMLTVDGQDADSTLQPATYLKNLVAISTAGRGLENK
jgi:hypothetical protein